MPEILCRPVFNLGTGLGNRLFPWARCLLFARHHGARMIDPIWERPAIGQLFRGGIDYPSYLRQLVMFRLMQRNPANLRGASSFAAWARFFGQMPTASHPGQPLQVWYLYGAPGRYLGELDPTRPAAEFLRDTVSALAAG